MATNKKLIDLNEGRTREERAEAARVAGRASGEARRKKRTMREWAEVFGASAVQVKTPDGATVDSDLDGSVVLAQYQKASRGDTRAARFLAELKGETDRSVSLEMKEGMTIIVNNPDEKRKLEDISKLDI